MHMTWQMLGATTAVPGYGILSNTILELTLAKYKFQRILVCSQLNNMHIVAPFANKNWVIECNAQYLEILRNLYILLASDFFSKV